MYIILVLLSTYEIIRDVFNREEMLGRDGDGIFWERNLRQNAGMEKYNSYVKVL